MILTVSEVSKAFGATQALRGVSLGVESGEALGLLGENGSGKSTLMRILHGEVRPDAGAMRFDDSPFDPRSPREAIQRGVALVHQELAIADHLTVAENVFLGTEISRGGRCSVEVMESATQAALVRLGRSDLDPRLRANVLSTGDRQLIEIARALQADAKLILFDEPTSSLSHAETKMLFDVIRRLKSEGRAVIYITHFLDEVREICDRIAVLRDGELVGDQAASESSPSELASLMSGREAQLEFFSRGSPGGSVFEALSVSGQRLQTPANLSLRKGEIVGIAGLNGSGRTELARLLFGLDRSKGVVSFNGRAFRQSVGERWQRRVGFVSEDRKNEGLALEMSLADNIHLPIRGAILRSWSAEVSGANQVLEVMQVKRRSESQRVSDLSGGNQQKVALARLLQSQAEVWILDEPTRGIDVRTKNDIFRLICEKASSGLSVLLISSQIEELLAVCNRILVMRRGEIVGEVDPSATSPAELVGMCAGA